MIINSLNEIQMKKFTYVLLACSTMIGLSFFSCSSNDTIEETPIVTDTESATSTNDQVTVLEVSGLSGTESFVITAGISSMNCDSLNAAMQPTDSLTAEEIAYLLDLREGRKLQHDLMKASREAYADEEMMPKMEAAHKTHKDAVARMLGFYGVEAPELGEAGVFENPTLQASYDAAVAAMTSETEAIQVLMGQKELIIIAYTEDLTTVTNENIQMLLENMLRAAKNHLCAFNMHLLEFDLTYVPTLISQAEYEAIIAEGIQRGPAHSGKNKFGKTNGEKGGRMNSMDADQARGKGQAGDGNQRGGKGGQGGQDDADGEATDGNGDKGTGRKGPHGGRGGHGNGTPGGETGDTSSDDSTDDTTE